VLEWEIKMEIRSCRMAIPHTELRKYFEDWCDTHHTPTAECPPAGCARSDEQQKDTDYQLLLWELFNFGYSLGALPDS